LIRATEGELSRTIASLSTIDNARVHIVLPKKEVFSRTVADPSASIMVRTKGGQTLSKPEVAAIAHLVATAVPGLKVDNITIIDQRGKPLKLGSGDEKSFTEMSEGITDFQRDIEKKLKTTIEDLLERSLGPGKVQASVSAEINFDREVVNTEVYDPDGQVLRSRKVSEENEQEKEGATELSITSNTGGTGNPENQSGRNRVRTDELTNYEISKTITNKISEAGQIKKLSIAILVDGNYTTSPDNPANKTYAARSQDELDKLKALASSAVGLDPKRGDSIEVVNMQFTDEFDALPSDNGTFGILMSELANIVQTVVIGVVLVLMLMLVVRPVLLKAIDSKRVYQTELQTAINTLQQDITTNQELQEKEEQEEIIDLTVPEDKRRSNLVKQVNDLVEKHPDETVSIIRNWLYANER
jgi:flagellar M-ring protein FliF